LLVVVEILNEDGSEVTDEPHGREFDIAQLKLLEEDRQADGYINLDGTNYVFNAKIVGVVAADQYDDISHAVTPIESAL
jgi:hypothetical protein